MAKQLGPIYLNGTIDGINFYTLNGVWVARQGGGGFTREAIKNSPKMEPVRRSNSEFGRVSGLNRELRQALQPFYAEHKDGSLAPRLQKLLCRIKALDTVSEHGQRQVGIGLATPMGKQLFEQFDFTPGAAHRLAAKEQFDWSSRAYPLAGFDPAQISFPALATHAGISAGILKIDFDAPQAFLYQSETFFIGRDTNGGNFSLDPVVMPEHDGCLLALRCLRFYQEIGGGRYLLKDKGLMEIAVLGIKP